MKLAQIMLDHKFTGNYRDIQVGDLIEFLCNGKGRGNHCRVTVKVKKINKKTFAAIEWTRSYAPGTKWIVNLETDLTIIERSEDWKSKYADPDFEEGDMVVVDRMHYNNGGKKGTIICLLESGEYSVQLPMNRKINIGPGLLKKVKEK